MVQPRRRVHREGPRAPVARQPVDYALVDHVENAVACREERANGVAQRERRLVEDARDAPLVHDEHLVSGLRGALHAR